MKKPKFILHKKIFILLFLPVCLILSCACTNLNQINTKNVESTNAAYKNDNYLNDAVGVSGKIVRWAKNPISIYIPENEYNKTIESAFKEWENASDKTITFKKTESKANADIKVTYTDIIDHKLEGLTKTYHIGNKILKAEIFLIDKNENKKPLDITKMHMLALHEIGHSLGIIGHSSNPNDRMSISDVSKLKSLSTNDINTLKLIYSDKNENFEQQTEILSKKLLEQEQKVKKAPNNKLQLLILADLYKNMKNYPMAIKTYEKIINLDKNCAQAYYSIGFCNYYTGQINKSLEYFKKAIEKEPDNIIFLHAYIKVCCETNNKNIAEKYLLKYIGKHPDLKDNPIIKESFRKLENS